MKNESSRQHVLQWKVPLPVLATLLIAVLLRASIGNTQEPCSSEELPVADAHFHLLDFLQNSAYLDPQSGEEMSPVAARSLPVSTSQQYSAWPEAA